MEQRVWGKGAVSLLLFPFALCPFPFAHEQIHPQYCRFFTQEPLLYLFHDLWVGRGGYRQLSEHTH